MRLRPEGAASGEKALMVSYLVVLVSYAGLRLRTLQAAAVAEEDTAETRAVGDRR